MSEQTIHFTQHSQSTGCDCKIPPTEQAKFVDPNLLAGNKSCDDAVVYERGNLKSVCAGRTMIEIH